MRQTTLRPGRGFAASAAQRKAVHGRACIVCEASPVDPAHVISRSLGGCDDALCVVPLDRECHRDYDEGRLNLLPYLEPDWRAQLAHAVWHVGVVGALRRISGPGVSSGGGIAPPRRESSESGAAGMLSEREVLALLAACPERVPGIRNRALICALWGCGLRVGEALALMPSDLDLPAGTLRVSRRDRSRTLGLDEHSALALSTWSQCRSALGLGSEQPLLCTLEGGRLNPVYVRRLLRRLACRAGITRPVTARALREAYAVELAHDTPIETVRDALGHSSVAVTARCLRRADPRAGR